MANVTSSSLSLRWAEADPKLMAYFEVAVTRLHDHALVLRKNVTGTELLVDGLDAGQTYHAVVTAHTADGNIDYSCKGTIPPSK